MAVRLSSSDRAKTFDLWQPYALGLARKFHALHRGRLARAGIDLEDVRQVAQCAMWASFAEYDPTRSKFSTYATPAVQWALMSLLKPGRSPAAVSLDRTSDESALTAATVADAAAPVPELAGRNEDVEMVHAAIRALPDRQRFVVILGLHGTTQKEIARRLPGDVTHQRISQLQAAGVKRLAAELRRRLPVTCAAG